MLTLTKQSGCKVNLLLNILGKRPDGFHELETLIQPIAVFDTLEFKKDKGLALSCSQPGLPLDSRNLVHRAATLFFERSRITPQVHIELQKRIQMAAGLGGGSGNAAITLVGLNELFDNLLDMADLQALAASLGSDVPFFLQSGPALAIGRGEQIEPLQAFQSLSGKCFVLVYPGFGVATAWAYEHLKEFPVAVNGEPGRARQLARKLQGPDVRGAAPDFYNALEFPVLRKHPLLALIREFLEAEGALVSRMSGSGSTIFGIVPDERAGKVIAEKVRERFTGSWTAVAAA